MSKFTLEEKLSVVQRYLEGSESYASLATSIGTAKVIVQNWVLQYKHHGVDAFTKPYTSYSAQFKLDVLHYMNTYGTSSYETAAIFNIPSPGLVRKWKAQFQTSGLDALRSKKKGRSIMKKESKKAAEVEGSVEALQQEIERLRMENAYLKKLNALVQSKEKLQNKTKRK